MGLWGDRCSGDINADAAALQQLSASSACECLSIADVIVYVSAVSRVVT